MTSTERSELDRCAKLTSSAAAYEGEKAAADQAIADERAAGAPVGTVNFSVRLPTGLAVHMRTAASQQQLPTSVWLRRVISSALQTPTQMETNDQHIEQVVRRILAENTSRAV